MGGLIITIILLAFFFQWRQKSREEKLRRISALKTTDRRLRNLAAGLSGGLVSADIRILLSQRGLETAKELKSMDMPDLADESMAEWAGYAEQASAAAAEPVAKLTDDATATTVRKLLKTLYRFIEQQILLKRLDQKTGQERLQQTQFLIARTLADAHHRKAVEATSQKRLRVAIHHYHDATAVFSQLQNNALATKYIAAYRSKITALEAQATEAVKEKSGSASSSVDEGSGLGPGWDSVNDGGESWKKKQAYDD